MVLHGILRLPQSLNVQLRRRISITQPGYVFKSVMEDRNGVTTPPNLSNSASKFYDLKHKLTIAVQSYT